MVSVGKPSYQRLRNYEDDEGLFYGKTLKREVRKAKAWLKFNALAGRRRPRLRIAGLRRFFRKRAKFVSRVRVSWRKALKRLKDGQSHWNDLFGSNFLFMQGNPTPFGCSTHKMKPYMGFGLQELPTTYSVGRIA
ncbi:uncharacterized protein LOC130712952 [Lotus japonicus]|uniref:uncharacterized protein LOC130712952 n=1 Tax=Lotus japonicus TaxID=34305 RepID=UPI0025870397|nr:uncharacterized protein LOC130712952 [Lotus japonicus]